MVAKNSLTLDFSKQNSQFVEKMMLPSKQAPSRPLKKMKPEKNDDEKTRLEVESCKAVQRHQSVA